MTNKPVRFLGFLGLSLAGMAGLYADVPYSGWVLLPGPTGMWCET